MIAEPRQAASDLVSERFPDAVAAFLGGTVLGPLRTPLSDLDVVVLRPESSPVFRETVSYAGWTVELFVSTPATYRATVEREVAARRSPVLHMVGEGVVVAGADAEAIAAEARALIAAGPPPVSDTERDGVRYLVSDLLDDLRGASDPAETAFVAIRAVEATARLALLTAGWWLGTGKWLGRRLREADPATHDALVAGLRAATAGDVRPLVAAGDAVLARVGGPLLVGYRSEPADPVRDGIARGDVEEASLEPADDGAWALTMTRDLRHPVERVWPMLTDPARLARWSPVVPDRPLTTVGPATARETPGEPAVDAEVLVCDPPRELVHRWGDHLLRWVLTPLPDGCRLTLTHTFAERPDGAVFAAGWHICLAVLEAVAGGADVERVVGTRTAAYGWGGLRERYRTSL